MSKFKVGDRVFDLRCGVGVVESVKDHHDYPVKVLFKSKDVENESYTHCGKSLSTHKNPLLLTLTEAREKGYDVPKESLNFQIKVIWDVYSTGPTPVPINQNEHLPRVNKKMGTLTFVEDVQ